MDLNRNTIVLSVISLIIIVGFLFGVYFLTNSPSTSTVVDEAKKVQTDDHMKWATDKKTLLVEYGDIQCPSCGAFHGIIKNQIEAKNSPLTKKITFIFRHFPLNQHQWAYEAAYSAEAAGKQGKFFEMTDLQYDHQTEWENSKDAKEDFKKFAEDLKLNMDQYEKDRTSQEVKSRVDRDYQSGIAAGVNATPTFYLNGVKMDITSADDFIAQLNKAAK